MKEEEKKEKRKMKKKQLNIKYQIKYQFRKNNKLYKLYNAFELYAAHGTVRGSVEMEMIFFTSPRN